MRPPQTSQTIHLLLIPGIAMSRREFDELKNSLQSQSPRYEVHCFENLCVGQGRRMERPSIAEFAMYQVEQYLKLNADKPFIPIGFSMGGMIAAEIAHLKPQLVQKLILISTAINKPSHPAVPDPLYEALIKIQSPEELSKSLEIGFSSKTLITRRKVFEQYFNYRLRGGNHQSPMDFLAQLEAVRRFDGPKVFKALHQRGLGIDLIFGTDDQLFDQTYSHEFAEFGAKLHSLSGMGHMLHLENIELLTEKIKASLNS